MGGNSPPRSPANMKTASILITTRYRSRRAQAAFTLIELLVVIAIMGILAGFLVGLAPAAGAKMRESRVRAELASLTSIIEAYKAKYGFYPPDGFDKSTGLVDPRLSPLYYELTGMQVINPKDAARGVFKSVSGGETVKPRVVEALFGRDGFANSGADRRQLFNASFRASQHAVVFTDTSDPTIAMEVLAVGVPFPANHPDYPIKNLQRGSYTLNKPGVNPWRYVSSTPTNNPTSFDLWAEIPVRDRTAPNGYSTRIIGNWKNR